MTKVTYLGDGAVEWFGLPFAPNLAVDLDDTQLRPDQRAALTQKAKGNPFFNVSGEPAAEAEDDETEEDLDGFKIVSVGKGWFKIVDPEGLDTEGKFRKADAEAKVVDLAAARA